MTSAGGRVDSFSESKHRFRVSLPSRIGMITEIFNLSSDEGFPYFGKTYAYFMLLSSDLGEFIADISTQDNRMLCFGFGLTRATVVFILDKI